MQGGAVFGVVFFVLLAFAAVTSIIAIIEPIVRYSQGKWGMSRRNGCILFGSLAWLLGLLTVFSFNVWSDAAPLEFIPSFEGLNPFGLIDHFTANLLMPLGAIFMALFVGWLIKPEMLAEDLPFANRSLFVTWLWMIRVIVPIAITGVLIQSFLV